MKFRLAYVIVLLMLLAFILQLIYPEIMPFFMFSSYSLFSAPWTIVTSAFMHADFPHLFVNLLAFFFFAITVEKKAGKVRMLAAFVAGAALGNIAIIVLSPPGANILGATAGVLALVGAAILLLSLDWRVSLSLLLFVLLVMDIDPYALAGYAASLIAGIVLGVRYRSFAKKTKRIAPEIKAGEMREEIKIISVILLLLGISGISDVLIFVILSGMDAWLVFGSTLALVTTMAYLMLPVYITASISGAGVWKMKNWGFSMALGAIAIWIAGLIVLFIINFQIIISESQFVYVIIRIAMLSAMAAYLWKNEKDFR